MGSGALGEALLPSKHLLIFKRIKHKPNNYTNEQLCELKTAGINSNANTHVNELETKGAQAQGEADTTDLSLPFLFYPPSTPLSLQLSISCSSLSERDLSAIMWLPGSDEAAKM